MSEVPRAGVAVFKHTHWFSTPQTSQAYYNYNDNYNNNYNYSSYYSYDDDDDDEDDDHDDDG